MCTPEKSSDEILQELFGLCQQKQLCKSAESSQENEWSDSSDVKSTDTKKHKHKKKKKKHKKTKKRRRSASILSNGSESSYKLKKKQLKLNTKENSENYPGLWKKIKIEKEGLTASTEDKKPNIDELEVSIVKKNNNCKDSLYVKKLTLDDVFNTISIETQRELLDKIKREKDETLLTPNKIKKEKLEPKASPETEKLKEITEDKKHEFANICPVKEKLNIEPASETSSNGKTENGNLAVKATAKTITIKNLRNSAVYEAVIKEVEEKERQKSEKYEEGEISSSSRFSSLDSIDRQIKAEEQWDLNDHRSHKHGRSKINGEHEKHHRSHSRKKKRHHHRQEKSRKKHERDDRMKCRSRSSTARNSRLSDRNRSLSARNKSGSPVRKNRRSAAITKRLQSYNRSRSKSRGRAMSNHRKSKSKSVERIDKLKLLEIARKNAINLLQQGALPTSMMVNKNKIASIKAGGKTVDELTDFCKQLSKREAEGDDSDNSMGNVDSDDGKSRPFHHPFQLKERPSNIVMNIRNAVSLPTKTPQEKTVELSKQLSLQYPVSSGQQHHRTESVWVPVERTQANVTTSNNKAVNCTASMNGCSSVSYPTPSVVTCPTPGTYSQPIVPDNSIIPPAQNIDISSIVAQRLEAIRRLSENPCDPVQTNVIQAVDSKMTVWAESKVQPGLFTGSNGVKPLSAAELSGGYQAWPKKNQFIIAKPVSSDKGEALMKKMGWQPGEGLGKYKQGPSVPCEINMKTDRRGLAEQFPIARNIKQPNEPNVSEIDFKKHPVSILNEYCSRKKIGVPQYDCEEKEGVARRKLYLFSVTVNGFKYTPSKPSTNKKQSKMEAATLCLQTLGLLPIMQASD